MPGIDMAFLLQACSRSWSAIEIGGIDQHVDGSRAVAANHVYVDVHDSFLITATAIELRSGEEVFGITIIKDPAAIQRFREGPHPPHNRPRTLSFEQLVNEDAGEFLKAPKHAQVIRRTVTIAASVASLVSIEVGLTVEASGVALSVFADDERPMGLKIRVTQVSHTAPGAPSDHP